MALTDEQLENIKTKIETDKIIPMAAIKELFPDEDVNAVRRQLFGKYNRRDLLKNRNKAETRENYMNMTKEQKLERIETQLSNIEERKAKLLQRRANLESD